MCAGAATSHRVSEKTNADTCGWLLWCF